MGETFEIGRAVMEMRQGNRIARAGWNGKNMHLALQMPDAGSKNTLPYVYMITVTGDRAPWLCSQPDLLADDWQVV